MNKVAKLIKSLAAKKNRDEKGLFVVEGARFVREITDETTIAFYAYSETFSQKNPDFYFRPGVEKYLLEDKTFKACSDTLTPQGVLAVCDKINYGDCFSVISGKKNGVYLILENISDPGNVGTIIRTAHAAGIKAVFLTENTVDLYNTKVLRSTMGSVFKVPVFNGVELDRLLKRFKEENIPVMGTDTKGGEYYYNADLSSAAAIIIGSEAAGLSQRTKDACDKIISIPMEGGAESLNAAVAAAVLMYEALRQCLTE